jgi:ketosteroid isomerase-like protein
MKTFLAVLIAVTLVGCAGTAEPPKTLDAANEFKPMIEKLMAAWETLDVSKPAAFYAKDPGLTFFDIAPLKYEGWQQYSDGFKKVCADWKSVKLTLDPDLKATQNGNVAWVTYTLSFVIEPKSGETMKGQARATDIFEKRGNDWLIVHEHYSAPMPEEPPKPPAKGKKK